MNSLVNGSPTKHSDSTQIKSVSVIILNDSNAVDFSATLLSVLRQSYANLECLVVDITNDAECLAIIQSYQNKIIHFRSEAGANKYKLVDEVVPFVKSEFICVIESGWKLHDTEAIALMMHNAAGYDIIYGDYGKVYRAVSKAVEVRKFANMLRVDDLLDNAPDIFTTAIVSSNLYKQFLFYVENLKFNIGWFFIFRLLTQAKAKVQYVDNIFIDVVVGRHGSIERLSNINLALRERQHIFKEYFPAQVGEVKINEVSQPYGQGFLNSLKSVYRLGRYNIRSLRSWIELSFYKRKYSAECFKIPIIINNKNHLTYLRRLITSLERRGYHNIYIIDNASTYTPLLKFYEETSYTVFRLKENVGFCALWDTEIFDMFKGQYYVYTDSDLELIDECPDDFMVVMHYIANKYGLNKVGFSLPIDDLPAHFANAEEVKKWESWFSTIKIERLAFEARVDTTFALYKPDTFGDATMLISYCLSL